LNTIYCNFGIELYPKIAQSYRGLSSLTLQRDLETLTRLGLLVQEKKRYKAHKELLQMFMPRSTAELERSV
jgi:hypothetical protein